MFAGVRGVEDFTERMGRPSALPKELREGHDLRQHVAEKRRVARDARLLAAQPGEQRTAARIAHGVLRIGAVEANAAGGEPVQVRRLRERMSVATDGVTQIVGHDEQDIRLAGRDRGDG